MLCGALLVIEDPSIVSTSHEKGQDDDLDGSHHPPKGQDDERMGSYNSLNLHFTPIFAPSELHYPDASRVRLLFALSAVYLPKFLVCGKESAEGKKGGRCS